MRIVRMLLRAPPAVMYWLGVGQARAMEQGENAILLCHGTPLRSAASLERQLRYLRRVFTLVPFAELAASTGAARARRVGRGRELRAVDETTGLPAPHAGGGDAEIRHARLRGVRGGPPACAATIGRR